MRSVPEVAWVWVLAAVATTLTSLVGGIDLWCMAPEAEECHNAGGMCLSSPCSALYTRRNYRCPPSCRCCVPKDKKPTSSWEELSSATQSTAGELPRTSATITSTRGEGVTAPPTSSEGEQGKAYMICRVVESVQEESPSEATANYETNSSGGCPKCPFDDPLNPVCGSDGKEYPSVCHVQESACRGLRGVVVGQADLCDSYLKNITADPCNFECLIPDVPVCGSDGRTYPSLCHLEREAACKGSDLTYLRKGACEPDSPKDCPKNCSYGRSHTVCGSDGVTYPSLCHLTDARVCQGHHVFPLHDGKCTPVCPKECPAVEAPVCYSDGSTYPNLCIGRFLACRGRPGRFKHSGFCNNQTECKTQPCPLVLAPVCGSNGRTYPNQCVLREDAECRREPVFVLHQGSCTSKPPPAKKCPKSCPKKTEPVCGSDGKTYNSLCHLQEAVECKRCRVKVMAAGPCETLKSREPPAPNRCPPPVSVSRSNCNSRQDTCYSCRDCEGSREKCCFDGCSFHCIEAICTA